MTDWFDDYPGRIPLLGNVTTDESTVAREVAVADTALDFFDILYYDGGADCGSAAGEWRYDRHQSHGPPAKCPLSYQTTTIGLCHPPSPLNTLQGFNCLSYSARLGFVSNPIFDLSFFLSRF